MARRAITHEGYRIVDDRDFQYRFEVEGDEAWLTETHDRRGEGREPEAVPAEVVDALREVGIGSVGTSEGADLPVSGGQDDAVDKRPAETAEAPEDDADGPDVTDIDRVGPARAERLREAGLETPEDVLDAGADALVAEAGLPEWVAETVVENAVVDG
jgi:hypothetical protein